MLSLVSGALNTEARRVNTLFFKRISAAMIIMVLLANASFQEDRVQHTLLSLGHDASVKKYPKNGRRGLSQ
jgi:hypothetical protein